MIKLHGAKELEAVLKQFPDYIAKKIATGALNAGAEVIKKAAIQNAPIGDQVHKDKKGNQILPGTLKKSIRKWKLKGENTVNVGVGLPNKTRAWYGSLVEFGTSKMSARPWLRPAFDNNVSQALDVVGKKLGDGIERAAKKLAGKYSKSGVRRK